MIHFITAEYPPDSGGVGDYTALITKHLANIDESVHVWTSGHAGESVENKAKIHRVARGFGLPGLLNLDRALNRTPPDRRIIVQWTPHSFGFRSLNLALPLWLWKRALIDKDRIELMVHEPFVAFLKGEWRQNLAAAIHRVMIAILLNAASKVFISIPAWEAALRPWCFGRPKDIQWLPVPSNIQTSADPATALHFRTIMARKGLPIVGHFGTFRDDIARLLIPAIVQILETSEASVLLTGSGSIAFQARFIDAHPGWADRIVVTGALPGGALAAFLSACDVLLQPYPDGISTRRGSSMAALALGVPIVTNLGPLSEPFWPQTGAIAIAPSSNSQDLAATTLNLCANLQRLSALAKRGRELYAQRFDVVHTVHALCPISHDRQASEVAA